MRVKPVPARRAAAPDRRPGGREAAPAARQGPARRSRRGRAARSSSPPPTPWPGPRHGKKVILVREETNPEDVEGMRAAVGILTARGGMTCHAALVARGWGKCCIVGAGALEVDAHARPSTVGGKAFKEGDWLTLNGTKGHVYPGRAADDRRHREPALQRVHEARGQRPPPQGAHQRRHAGGRRARRARSAPRASACSAPSTCSTARARDEPLFLLRKMIVSQDARTSGGPRWTSSSPS